MVDKFYRQSVGCDARCCRESGMLFVQAQAEAWRARRSRHRASGAGASQVRLRSRYSCDTVSGRVPRRIGEVVGKVEEEFWKMVGGDCSKKWRRRGGSNNRRQQSHPSRLGEHLQHSTKSRQSMLTKQSAATAPLSALTRASLGPSSKVPFNLGNPSAWVLPGGACLVLGPPADSRPLTRAFACLELPQSSSSSCLPSPVPARKQPLQTTSHSLYTSQPISSHPH